MALTKEQKHQLVEEIRSLLESSKLSVVANYSGTSVKQMQDLRKMSSENGTTVKVLKNRLVKVAMGEVDKFNNSDTSALNSQLLYAFSSEDDVAPAQMLHKFNKKGGSLEFVGAFTSDGSFIGHDDVKALANLPSKQQLRAQLVGCIRAPLSGFVGVLNGNLQGVIGVLNARAESIK